MFIVACLHSQKAAKDYVGFASLYSLVNGEKPKSRYLHHVTCHISLRDIWYMPMRSVLALFRKFCNFYFDVLK